MKKNLLIAAVLMVQSSAFAWVNTEPTLKDYKFKYKLSGQTLEISKQAGSYEEAFKQAAQQCFQFYKGEQNVSQDRGLDIIDVCANPRS